MSFAYLSGRVKSLVRGDKLIWFCIAMLALISIITVYSSAEALAHRTGTNTTSLLVKHIVMLMGAMGVIYICHLINYMRYGGKFAPMLLSGTVLLLISTLLFGVTLNEATRWIRIPFIGITFQPSELAKIALVVHIARTIAINKEAIGMLIMPVLVVCVLIAPMDLSTSVVIFATCMLLMFIGKVPLRDVFTVFMLGVGVFAVLIALSEYFPQIRKDTWVNRLAEFAGEKEPFQVLQAKMAIAKGGLLGVGPGNGMQAHFLPHAYSDYIFCIIIEEYGMLGAIVVLAIYLTLLVRCVRLVTRSPKAFGAMLATGLCLGIVLQGFAHMAVNVNLVPVTGLTLPFISMGGTSLLFTGISFGMILSVSRYVEAATVADSNDPNAVAAAEAAAKT